MGNKEMLCFSARISRCLLALLLLREAAGATFFHLYETELRTLTCNESFGGDNATWWIGQQTSSLQKFERWCYYQNGVVQTHSKNSNHENCPNNLSLSNFSSGGIFACKTQVGHLIKTLVFSSKNDCTNFNFFIVAIIKNSTEQRSENIGWKAEEKVSTEENQNFTLSCEFELGKDTTDFAVYWFKETKPSKCLFSASNEGYGTAVEVSYDINCCIDDAFRDRRIKNSTILDRQHRSHTHVVTITNSTTADNGSYLCLVAAYNKRYRWTIERRISVNVKEASPDSPPNPTLGLKIPLAAIAAVIVAALLLMSGVILFLYCKKKAKGKPLESQQRDQTTVATEDCSPYAVSSRNDLNGQETVYSLATNPGEAPSAAYFSSQSKPAPRVQHGENVEALYSKVLKDKNGPSLASDSSV